MVGWVGRGGHLTDLGWFWVIRFSWEVKDRFVAGAELPLGVVKDSTPCWFKCGEIFLFSVDNKPPSRFVAKVVIPCLSLTFYFEFYCWWAQFGNNPCHSFDCGLPHGSPHFSSSRNLLKLFRFTDITAYNRVNRLTSHGGFRLNRQSRGSSHRPSSEQVVLVLVLLFADSLLLALSAVAITCCVGCYCSVGGEWGAAGAGFRGCRYPSFLFERRLGHVKFTPECVNLQL